MPSEARQKKIMEKLNRAQKCSILGPQNLGSGGPGPRGPPGSAPARVPCPKPSDPLLYVTNRLQRQRNNPNRENVVQLMVFVK